MKSLLILAFISLIFAQNLLAEKSEKIIGTIGNEKMGSDKIVICVYGTAACMPVNIDTKMTVVFQGKQTKLTDLPFGLYLEANISTDKNNEKIIKKLIIDETKTVICFTELDKKQQFKLSRLLHKIKGVKNFKINSESKQVYIKYVPQIITYNDLENKIKKVGFNLE
jgi:hypothetical protein